MQLSEDDSLELASRLKKQGRLGAAEAVLERALMGADDNPRLTSELQALTSPDACGGTVDDLRNLGMLWWGSGRPDHAGRFFDRALSLDPGDLSTQLNIAVVERAFGNKARALEICTNILERDPGRVMAYKYATDMRTTTEADSWLDTLQNVLQSATGYHTQATLSFALAKALDDVDRVDDAFAAFEVANLYKLAGSRHDPSQVTRALAITGRALQARAIPQTLEPSEDVPGQACPIFIVGLPRTGSTLVERILSCHSEVHAGGERHDLSDVISEAVTKAQLYSEQSLRQIRQDYLMRMPLGPSRQGFVTDKTPDNSRWIGLIRAALPEAKIVEVVRDQVATGWSMYRHDFAEGSLDYTCDFGTIIAHMKAHREMMDGWHDRHPGNIIQVNYETLCAQPDVEVPKLLDALGLPFEAACLSPHAAAGVVATASMDQVRRAIYADGSEAWKRYAGYLTPLTNTLPSARSVA